MAEPEVLDDAQQAEAARNAAARGLARGGRRQPEAFIPTIASDEDFDKLKPGSTFIDPEGNKRTRPWIVKEDDDFAKVPEGAQFLDPEGELRVKPKYEGVNFTSQTLYNMATNDRERQKALELGYPGKVVKEGGEFIINDEGVQRKPRGMTETGLGLAGGVASMAAPTAGAIAGEIGGGLLANLPGAIGGGMAGAMLGQGFNDAILSLAGVYDRSVGEQVGETALAGGLAAGGTVAGRVLGGATPYLKGKAKQALPKAAADFLGADAEGLRTAIQLREKGVDLVPPSGWAKESPHLINIAEVLDPAFRTQQPMKQAAEKHFEKAGGEVLEGLGVKSEGSLVNPTGKTSSKEAGESILLKAREELNAADAKVREAFEQRKQAMAAGLPQAPGNALQQAESQARQAAQKVIDGSFQDIEQDVARAMKVAEADHNAGDLWQMVATKLQAVRQGIMQRGSKMYAEADQLAGAHLPNSEGLAPLAKSFLDEVPPDFKSRYPSIVQKLEQLAGVTSKDGEIVKEAVTPTFGQLHNMRSMLRDGADWYTLSSDVKNGSYKFFAKAVDDALHDVNAVPELKAAAQMLDKADAFYRENMRVFNARQLKAVTDGLRAGEPADPTQLFNAIVKEGHTDLTGRIMEMIGPNLAAGVRAADVKSMLDNSKTLIPGELDGAKFAREVLERYRSGMLHTIHGQETGDKLLRQAQHIAALEGKLDIPARPGDTALDTINRARAAAEQAKSAAKVDPLTVLNKETKKLEVEQQKTLAKMRAERRSDPLRFLYNSSIGGVEAADRILASEDLILAAGAKFGDKSPEFNMLRQVYAKRILESTTDIGNKLANISPEIQQIMFPGVTFDQMKVLAKEMDFLLSSRAMQQGTGKSIMATARVEHPWGAIPFGKGFGKIVPGADPAGRSMLGSYYKFVTGAMNNLTFLRWVEKGLKGDAAAREMTRREVQRMMQRGGAIGAGVAESQNATPQQSENQ